MATQAKMCKHNDNRSKFKVMGITEANNSLGINFRDTIENQDKVSLDASLQ